MGIDVGIDFDISSAGTVIVGGQDKIKCSAGPGSCDALVDLNVVGGGQCERRCPVSANGRVDRLRNNDIARIRRR